MCNGKLAVKEKSKRESRRITSVFLIKIYQVTVGTFTQCSQLCVRKKVNSLWSKHTKHMYSIMENIAVTIITLLCFRYLLMVQVGVVEQRGSELLPSIPEKATQEITNKVLEKEEVCTYLRNLFPKISKCHDHDIAKEKLLYPGIERNSRLDLIDTRLGLFCMIRIIDFAYSFY
ncbi:hypothetical protein BD770DRAFT_432857 [Pilaira anomala]|nr:hypothetical protein BD770DRAFT_432857 [Pilaira anomala]